MKHLLLSLSEAAVATTATMMMPVRDSHAWWHTAHAVPHLIWPSELGDPNDLYRTMKKFTATFALCGIMIAAADGPAAATVVAPYKADCADFQGCDLHPVSESAGRADHVSADLAAVLEGTCACTDDRTTCDPDWSPELARAVFGGIGRSGPSDAIYDLLPSVEFACADATSPWSLLGQDDLSGEACNQATPLQLQVAETLTADGQGILDGDGSRIVSF